MTILAKIGFSRKDLDVKIRDKIRIDPELSHYPDNPHSKHYHWNWCRDEFSPPLSHQELKKYISSPDVFRKDFLGNLKLYIKFCEQIFRKLPNLKKLDSQERMIAYLSLLFLFQSAMDQHYSKFDNLLDVEECPGSPLGFHYLRMKEIVKNAATKIKPIDRKVWIEEKLLNLLGKSGRSVIAELKDLLTPVRLKKLNESYEAVQIYLKVQQEEEVLFFGPHRDGVIYKVGFEIVNGIIELVSKGAKNCKDKTTVLKLLKGEPAYGTRMLLVYMGKYFTSEVITEFKKEIHNW